MTTPLKLLALLLAAFLSGCTASDPPAVDVEDVVEEAAAPDPTGLTTTLTRVVPRSYEIDWTAYQAVGPCAPDGSTSCREPLIQIDDAVVGYTYNTPQWVVNDADALFWRLDAVVEWSTDNPIVTEANLEVFMRKSCGVSCWEERSVEKITGPSPLVFERRDLFLEEGETGLLLRVSAPVETATPGFGTHFRTTGHADGYVAAGDPPIVIEG